MGENIGSAKISGGINYFTVAKLFRCRINIGAQNNFSIKKTVRKQLSFMVQKYKCLHHKAQAQAQAQARTEPNRAGPGRVESVGRARVCGGHDAWSPSSQQCMYWEPKAPT